MCFRMKVEDADKMKLANNIFRYTVYRKLFISYMLLVAATVTVICSALYYLFSVNTINEINNMSQSILTQTSYSCDVIYEQAFSVGNQLMNDHHFLKVMSTQEKDYIMDYQTVLRLSNIQAVYPFINYISIYNGNTGKLISKKWGLSSEIDEDIIDYISKSSENKYFEFLPRKVRNPYTSSPPYYNALTFILYSGHYRSSDQRSALIINVDEQYVQNTIRGMSNSPNDNIFVINSAGTVLSHTKSEFFLEDFSKYPYIQIILNSRSPKGYNIASIDGENQLVTYVKSDKLDWVFVSVKPFSLLLYNLNHLRNITLITGMVLIFIGIFLSFYLTRNVYNPLQSLMKKINSLAGGIKQPQVKYNEFELITEALSSTINRSNSLEYSLETTYPLLKETYLRFILRGDLPDVPGAIEKIQDIDRNLTGPYFCVLLIKIDNYRMFKENLSQKDQSLYRFSICNVAQELMEKSGIQNDAVSVEGSSVVLLLQLSENTVPDNVTRAVIETKDFMQQHFKLSISISIGDVVPSVRDIHQSYESALEYSNYRLFFGHGSVIKYALVRDQLNNADEHPHQIEKKLLDAIQLNNHKTVVMEISRFIDAIKVMTYHHATVCFNQLLISISKQFYDTVDFICKNESKYYDLVHNLSEFETINDISEALNDFCLSVCNTLEEKRSGKNIQTIQEVKEYIARNYSNPNLSLESVADVIHLSPGYLGKLFKSITNIAFNDYLNLMRLEKAKELMLSTSEPASVICEKVGVFNNTYFFTLFKKTYGMTPTQFRKQYTTENPVDKSS